MMSSRNVEIDRIQRIVQHRRIKIIRNSRCRNLCSKHQRISLNIQFILFACYPIKSIRSSKKFRSKNSSEFICDEVSLMTTTAMLFKIFVLIQNINHSTRCFSSQDAHFTITVVLCLFFCYKKRKCCRVDVVVPYAKKKLNHRIVTCIHSKRCH